MVRAKYLLFKHLDPLGLSNAPRAPGYPNVVFGCFWLQKRYLHWISEPVPADRPGMEAALAEEDVGMCP